MGSKASRTKWPLEASNPSSPSVRARLARPLLKLSLVRDPLTLVLGPGGSSSQTCQVLLIQIQVVACLWFMPTVTFFFSWPAPACPCQHLSLALHNVDSRPLSKFLAPSQTSPSRLHHICLAHGATLARKVYVAHACRLGHSVLTFSSHNSLQGSKPPC